jgi:hypothetical protein
MLNQILIDLLYLISFYFFVFNDVYFFSNILKLIEIINSFLTFLILPVGINLLVTSRYFSELILNHD